MSISVSGIQSSTPFVPPGNISGSLSGNSTSSVQGAVLANLDIASSGVSAALQSLSNSLGSIVDTLA